MTYPAGSVTGPGRGLGDAPPAAERPSAGDAGHGQAGGRGFAQSRLFRAARAQLWAHSASGGWQAT